MDNVRGEPVICSPKDVFICSMGAEMELLVIGNFILCKETRDQRLKMNYSAAFEPD